MLVPYQLPQFGILIIRQMVCKKRAEKEKKRRKQQEKLIQPPFPFVTKKCHNDFLNNHVPKLLKFWSTN